MKTEIKIIKSLIENKQLTIREISKNIKSDYKITHTAIQRLLIKKIISIETIGKSSLCRLNRYDVEIYIAEEERKKNILKNKNMNQLYKEILKNIKTSFFILLVFGSYAKNKQTKNSDIDILLISNEKKTENYINSILSILPLKTHFLTFTEEEFTRMNNSKEGNIVHEIIENNIILYGIENYYKLKNA